MGWFTKKTITFNEAMSIIIGYMDKTGITRKEFNNAMIVVHGNDAAMQIDGMIANGMIER